MHDIRQTSWKFPFHECCNPRIRRERSKKEEKRRRTERINPIEGRVQRRISPRTASESTTTVLISCSLSLHDSSGNCGETAANEQIADREIRKEETSPKTKMRSNWKWK
ncbi:hypothetical protein BDV39DRAFT_27124 [Aspergillus sergii]|uniref:Uncharacterized protein n=1 Tax=Aspergillus sergii TaxID=1034303 RepID=A0A5N6XEG1_9EURO|nr:hypothetical protein BDV39DRAFT_27124 [Aspergillus sergii]